MGGYGSGRPKEKVAVEDCRALDLGLLERDGAFVPNYVGVVRWRRGDCNLGSIGYRVEQSQGDRLWLLLDYVWGEAKEHVVIPVALETTRPHFGGVRWWGRCPLAVGGVACNRRVRKLYLRGRYFGCRRCHALTYKSCQESHQYDRLFASMGKSLGWPADEVKRILNASARANRRR